MTVSNSFVIAWLLLAQVMSRVASAAAPRITSAYSAVVWPSSLVVERTAVNDAAECREETTEHGSSLEWLRNG